MKIETINKLLGIKESYKAPDKLLKLMLEKETRENLFKEFLKHEKNLNYEWFRNYFENEHADRKVKKQDFTPNQIGELMVKLSGTEDSKTYHEITAGTGSIMIKNWSEKSRRNRNKKMYPRNYWYHVEELSDRAIPFLIFNMAIRGMNGVALHGDSLSREFKDVYFIRNDTDDYFKFSEIFKMPKTDDLKRELSIIKWSDDNG